VGPTMPRKLKPLYKQPDEVKKQYEGSIESSYPVL
jgi:hypothetical protein